MSVVTCALCAEDAECVGNLFICEPCSSKVTIAYLGRFRQLQEELGRERLANVKLSARALETGKKHSEQSERTRLAHYETNAALELRLRNMREYLMGLRAWPIRKLIDGAVACLDGKAKTE